MSTKYQLLALLLSSLITTAAQANPDDGYSAYKAGDYAKALKEFSLLAKQGDAHAQNNLGAMYAQGQGVPQDNALAVSWYRRAAEQGNVIAQVNMGEVYLNGKGVKQDNAQAEHWYLKAANQGNAIAQYNLGFMYEHFMITATHEISTYYVIAAQWYQKSAAQGYAPAQLSLGIFYQDGYGVPKDEVLAVQLFRKAAEKGELHAQIYLGNSYLHGTGVERDYALAMKWYCKAADQRFPSAYFKLGVMYFLDLGAQQNRAIVWALLDRSRELEGADDTAAAVKVAITERIQEYETKMSLQEITIAKQLSAAMMQSDNLFKLLEDFQKNNPKN